MAAQGPGMAGGGGAPVAIPSLFYGAGRFAMAM